MGLSLRPAQWGGAQPPAGHAAAGGPRGQAFALTTNATKRGAVTGHTALVNSIWLKWGAPSGAQFTQAALAMQQNRQRLSPTGCCDGAAGAAEPLWLHSGNPVKAVLSAAPMAG